MAVFDVSAVTAKSTTPPCSADDIGLIRGTIHRYATSTVPKGPVSDAGVIMTEFSLVPALGDFGCPGRWGGNAGFPSYPIVRVSHILEKATCITIPVSTVNAC